MIQTPPNLAVSRSAHPPGRPSRVRLPSPLAPLSALLVNRGLVLRLTRREIEARYRGSLLGLVWSVITPLLMLAVYTFVFSVVFSVRWGIESESHGSFALVLFAGLLAFNLLAECVNRAPTLVLENVSYVKKVVFPLETLAWVSLLSALFNTATSVLILLVAHLVLDGPPPPSSLLLPAILVPLCFFTLGVTWFLSAVGVYLRDIRQIVPVFTTALLFLSPIFYPASAVPEGYRALFSVNPLTPTVEGLRTVLFVGALPDWTAWAISLTTSAVVCWFGFAWFENTRRGFADVI